MRPAARRAATTGRSENSPGTARWPTSIRFRTTPWCGGKCTSGRAASGAGTRRRRTPGSGRSSPRSASGLRRSPKRPRSSGAAGQAPSRGKKAATRVGRTSSPGRWPTLPRRRSTTCARPGTFRRCTARPFHGGRRGHDRRGKCGTSGPTPSQSAPTWSRPTATPMP